MTKKERSSQDKDPDWVPPPSRTSFSPFQRITRSFRSPTSLKTRLTSFFSRSVSDDTDDAFLPSTHLRSKGEEELTQSPILPSSGLPRTSTPYKPNFSDESDVLTDQTTVNRKSDSKRSVSDVYQTNCVNNNDMKVLQHFGTTDELEESLKIQNKSEVSTDQSATQVPNNDRHCNVYLGKVVDNAGPESQFCPDQGPEPSGPYIDRLTTWNQMVDESNALYSIVLSKAVKIQEELNVLFSIMSTSSESQTKVDHCEGQTSLTLELVRTENDYESVCREADQNRDVIHINNPNEVDKSEGHRNKKNEICEEHETQLVVSESNCLGTTSLKNKDPQKKIENKTDIQSLQSQDVVSPNSEDCDLKDLSLHSSYGLILKGHTTTAFKTNKLKVIRSHTMEVNEDFPNVCVSRPTMNECSAKVFHFRYKNLLVRRCGKPKVKIKSTKVERIILIETAVCTLRGPKSIESPINEKSNEFSDNFSQNKSDSNHIKDISVSGSIVSVTQLRKSIDQSDFRLCVTRGPVQSTSDHNAAARIQSINGNRICANDTADKAIEKYGPSFDGPDETTSEESKPEEEEKKSQLTSKGKSKRPIKLKTVDVHSDDDSDFSDVDQNPDGEDLDEAVNNGYKEKEESLNKTTEALNRQIVKIRERSTEHLDHVPRTQHEGLQHVVPKRPEVSRDSPRSQIPFGRWTIKARHFSEDNSGKSTAEAKGPLDSGPIIIEVDSNSESEAEAKGYDERTLSGYSRLGQQKV